MPFDKIIDAVQKEVVEPAFSFMKDSSSPPDGLHRVLDLGIWWSGANRFAPSTGRECRAPRPGARNSAAKISRRSATSVSYGSNTEEALNSPAIRARNDAELARQVCRHVREQMDLVVRRKGAGRPSKELDQTRHQRPDCCRARLLSNF